MSQPLFLQSVMQEKIWGGTRLRDEFGYESRAIMLVNTGLFRPIHMVFLLLRTDLMLEWD